MSKVDKIRACVEHLPLIKNTITRWEIQFLRTVTDGENIALPVIVNGKNKLW